MQPALAADLLPRQSYHEGRLVNQRLSRRQWNAATSAYPNAIRYDPTDAVTWTAQAIVLQ